MGVWCPTCAESVDPFLQRYNNPTEVTEVRPRFNKHGFQSVEVGHRTKWSRESAYVCRYCGEVLPDLGAETYEDYKRRKAGRLGFRLVIVPVAIAIILSVFLFTILLDDSTLAILILLVVPWILLWAINIPLKKALLDDPKKVWIAFGVSGAICIGCIALLGILHSIRPSSPVRTAAPPEAIASSQVDIETPSAKNGLCGISSEDLSFEAPWNWNHYRCKNESKVPANVWKVCLDRKQYSKKPGTGCPGQDKCCPPFSVVE